MSGMHPTAGMHPMSGTHPKPKVSPETQGFTRNPRFHPNPKVSPESQGSHGPPWGRPHGAPWGPMGSHGAPWGPVMPHAPMWGPVVPFVGPMSPAGMPKALYAYLLEAFQRRNSDSPARAARVREAPHHCSALSKALTNSFTLSSLIDKTHCRNILPRQT